MHCAALALKAGEKFSLLTFSAIHAFFPLINKDGHPLTKRLLNPIFSKKSSVKFPLKVTFPPLSKIDPIYFLIVSDNLCE